MDDTFQRACKAMPQQPLYVHLLRIYEENNNVAKASKLLKVMCRKFKLEQSVWMQRISFEMRRSANGDEIAPPNARSTTLEQRETRN